MAGYRVLDIETVPDERFWTKNPDKWDLVPDLKLKPTEPGVVDFSFKRMTAGHGMYDNLAWEMRDQFPPPQAHRIVAMAWVDLSNEDDQWYKWLACNYDCFWAYDDAESDRLEAAMIAKFAAAQASDKATLVTWNGRGFDLPVVNMRSFLHKMPAPWYYEERDVRYRYTEAGHCDLMDVFGDYGAARNMKLGDVARLCGLPGKIGPVKGSAVAEIVAKHAGASAKELEAAQEAVGAYCLFDALQTAFVFARSRLHEAMIDRSHFDNVIAPSFEIPLATTQALVQRGEVAA